MFNEKDLVGKRIGDIITEDTKILTYFMAGYDVKEATFGEGNITIESVDGLAVISDYCNHLVLCVKDNNVVALFHVYDIYNVSLNSKRKMVTAVGHETNHQYWFEDGDYEYQRTR